MALYNIRNGGLGVNPASDLLAEMSDPTRTWAFDAEFLVKDISSDIQKFHFFIKQIDKPSYNFNYADINRYGYKHKILTGIETGDLGVQFIDDSTNKVLAFVNHYLNKSVYSKNSRFRQANSLPTMTREGFDTAGVKPSGSVGPGGTIIQQIKIHQYAGFSPDGTGRGRIRSWIFEQPQIVSFDLDAVASEEDSLSGFVINFNFKNVFIEIGTENYPTRMDNPLEAVLDLQTAFDLKDARLPSNIGKVVTDATGDFLNSFEIPKISNVASLANNVQNVNTLVRDGVAKVQKVEQTLRDPKRAVTGLINRNDYVIAGRKLAGSFPTDPGSILVNAPNIINQTSKLTKFFG